jgi:hypothetical protein
MVEIGEASAVSPLRAFVPFVVNGFAFPIPRNFGDVGDSWARSGAHAPSAIG